MAIVTMSYVSFQNQWLELRKLGLQKVWTKPDKVYATAYAVSTSASFRMNCSFSEYREAVEIRTPVK